MKKQLLAIGLFLTAGASAQTIVTFDDLTLDTNSYYNGSDGSGGFTSNGVLFPNSYDQTYMYWSGGFIYSNSTDVTTPGFTNDFSAFTGIGAGGSANYGVNYGGNIDFGSEKMVGSIAITNTTYAALSMKFGDSYGKQFGSPNDAQGNPDGTNGEDFFLLRIIGKNASSVATDTVDFYLADYRFADSIQDYIVNTWETVDLTSLGAVQFLEFELISSDNGSFGMNTPAYFALDNLSYGFAGISENTAETVLVYPNPTSNQLLIDATEGTLVVRNAAGSVVYTFQLDGTFVLETAGWNTGIYFIEIANDSAISRATFSKI